MLFYSSNMSFEKGVFFALSKTLKRPLKCCWMSQRDWLVCLCSNSYEIACCDHLEMMHIESDAIP